jgi:hypothetical protein
METSEANQIASVVANGFSQSRWLLWRRRLEEISRYGDDQVAKQARFVNIMNQRVKELSSGIRDDVEETWPGGAEQVPMQTRDGVDLMNRRIRDDSSMATDE